MKIKTPHKKNPNELSFFHCKPLFITEVTQRDIAYTFEANNIVK